MSIGQAINLGVGIGFIIALAGIVTAIQVARILERRTRKKGWF